MGNRGFTGQLLHDAIGRVGLKVSRQAPDYMSEFRLLVDYLQDHGIEHVLDVGANEGQFAGKLFGAGYPGTILSFEPMPDVHRRLVEAAASNPRWIIAPPVALSDRDGTADFHVAGNSISSSLLPMEELHLVNAPKSAEAAVIQVALVRLDAILPELLPEGRFLLKIDTQGTERDVLEGAAGVLDRVAGIKTEMSFKPLYAGQPLFAEMYGYITGLGFDAYHFVHGFRGRRRAALLQCDGLFFRASE